MRFLRWKKGVLWFWSKKSRIFMLKLRFFSLESNFLSKIRNLEFLQGKILKNPVFSKKNQRFSQFWVKNRENYKNLSVFRVRSCKINESPVKFALERTCITNFCVLRSKIGFFMGKYENFAFLGQKLENTLKTSNFADFLPKNWEKSL